VATVRAEESEEEETQFEPAKEPAKEKRSVLSSNENLLSDSILSLNTSSLFVSKGSIYIVLSNSASYNAIL
jgi:hypothetical protein